MGNTCKPMAVSFQCMTKSTTKKKKKKVKGQQEKKKKSLKKNLVFPTIFTCKFSFTYTCHHFINLESIKTSLFGAGRGEVSVKHEFSKTVLNFP